MDLSQDRLRGGGDDDDHDHEHHDDDDDDGGGDQPTLNSHNLSHHSTYR